jgi:translation initiation factor 4A
MGLSEALLRGVYSAGFERPSPVQARAIVPAMTGVDMVIQAQSGTGKTGAFGIALLHRLDVQRAAVQAITLAPTRELALQHAGVLGLLGDRLGARVHASVGGHAVAADAHALRGAQVVCGTPGRVLANLRGQKMQAHAVRLLVIDEVDTLLAEGSFQDQLRDIIALLPADVQILCVSATLSAPVLALTDCFLRDPVRILVPVEAVSLAGIAQFYIDCGPREDDKVEVLRDLYAKISVSQSVIFCNTRRRVLQVAAQLRADDFAVGVLHAELTQPEREAVLAAFVQGATRVLLATDIIGRGIDVQQVSVVINLELPATRANYIHRIGRAGRNGRLGIAINLIAPRDAPELQALEQLFHCTINELPNDIDRLVAGS